MAEQPGWNEVVQFRFTLEFNLSDQGFVLTSRAFRHSLKGEPWYKEIGAMIAKGNKSWDDIVT